eukprot:scaffold7346_cov245-Pinguiococcus_pyrenoidosus.AAC.37
MKHQTEHQIALRCCSSSSLPKHHGFGLHSAVQVFRPWLLAFGVRPLAFGRWLLAFGVWPLAFGLWRLAFGRWRLAVGVWRLAFAPRLKHVALAILACYSRLPLFVLHGVGNEAQILLAGGQVCHATPREVLRLLAGKDHGLVAGLPVGGRGDAHGRALEADERALDLCEGAAGGGRVREDELDLLAGVHDEHAADRHGQPRRIEVVLVQHAKLGGEAAIGVCQDGKLDRGPRGGRDVRQPGPVARDVVAAQGHELAIQLEELGRERGGPAQLGGADGREVRGVREQDAPAVSKVLVETDAAKLRRCGEIRLRQRFSDLFLLRGFTAHVPWCLQCGPRLERCY